MDIKTARNAAKAALVAAALLSATQSVQAKDAPYVFTAIDTARHGVDVLNGQYDTAITRIHSATTETDFSESTNLCIAYTKFGDVANAMQYCDRAVSIARKTNGMRRAGVVLAPFGNLGRDLDLVIALSNRSVARAVNGDYAMALEDLQEADALRPSLSAVPKNLEVLVVAMQAAH